MSIALHGPWPAPYSPQGNGGAPGATAHQQQLAGTAHTVSTRRFIKEAQAALSGIAASSGAGMPSSSASAVQVGAHKRLEGWTVASVATRGFRGCEVSR